MKIGQLLGIIIVALLISGGYLFNLYGDWLWFNSVGYPQVFTTVIYGSLFLAALTGFGFFLFSMANIIVARKLARKGKKSKKMNDNFISWLAGLFALGIGSAFSDWRVWLKYLNPTDFAATDPVFGLDVGFYVFTMPFFGYIITYFGVTLALTAILVFASYTFNAGGIKKDVRDTSEMEFSGAEFEIPSYSIDFGAMKKKLVPHLSVLLGMLMIVVSFGAILA